MLCPIHVFRYHNMVVLLARAGADVDCPYPSRGYTPLHEAASRGVAMAYTLMEVGARADIDDYMGGGSVLEDQKQCNRAGPRKDSDCAGTRSLSSSTSCSTVPWIWTNSCAETSRTQRSPAVTWRTIQRALRGCTRAMIETCSPFSWRLNCEMSEWCGDPDHDPPFVSLQSSFVASAPCVTFQCHWRSDLVDFADLFQVRKALQSDRRLGNLKWFHTGEKKTKTHAAAPTTLRRTHADGVGTRAACARGRGF